MNNAITKRPTTVRVRFMSILLNDSGGTDLHFAIRGYFESQKKVPEVINNVGHFAGPKKPLSTSFGQFFSNNC
jgi:hypothetical protein